MTTLTRPCIGILGSGQLGRMLAIAAAQMGIRAHIYAPDATGSPAGEVAGQTTTAAYTDFAALSRFAETVDAIIYEFENIPVSTAQYLATLKPVFPQPEVLRIAQDRLVEKTTAVQAGLATVPFQGVNSTECIETAGDIFFPAILKTRCNGYDGKGQTGVANRSEATRAFATLGKVPAILEKKIAFKREISIIAARGLDGSLTCYPAIENAHENHVLSTSTVPANIPALTSARALADTVAFIRHINCTGLITLEFFITDEGAVLFNECAPRPHNSGHWTIEGTVTCQFEQTLRAALGLPLGSSALRTGRAFMRNILGDAARDSMSLLSAPENKLHLYGKSAIASGRKMGHVTQTDGCPRLSDPA